MRFKPALALCLTVVLAVTVPLPLPGAAPAHATGITLTLKRVGKSFDRPLFLTAPAGSKRTFVVEQPGRIRSLDGRMFLDISSEVDSSGNEQGLLGLAFHPDYKRNGHLYVDYIDRDGNTVVSRFTAAANRKTAKVGSEKVILRVKQPAANHNGGMLAFGPDGDLYIGLGDGGGEDDAYHTGQDKQTLLAKILRINVDHGSPYTVPPTNPFVRKHSFLPETWDWGLRNPWRFSFDRKTGHLYIGDVGQDAYEEVDVEKKGKSGHNYGWSVMEATHCYQPAQGCSRTGLTLPVAEYPHSLGCAVTGGYVYRGKESPTLRGTYLFGDYCSGRIWTLKQQHGTWTMSQALKTNLSISSFGEDASGELYVADIAGGGIYRITAGT